MANHSGWVKRFRSDAELFLKAGNVRAVTFSQGTYQIEVFDPISDSSEWPFFQFDDKGELKDAFCSCEAEEGCIHLAAALMKIYDSHIEPLHIRFQRSFWNLLCHVLSEHCGYEISCFEKKKRGLYVYQNRIAIQLRAKNNHGIAYLDRILEDRVRETPENSLKFSNLSQEEIFRWREGRPSQTLRFELSFWADLAKDWMLRQDDQQIYHITFSESEEGFPVYLRLEWKDIEVLILLSPQDLPMLIPALATVQSSLKVHREEQRAIEAILYDAVNKKFTIKYRGQEVKKKEITDGIAIDVWQYVSGKGFYSLKDTSTVAPTEINFSEISHFLTIHAHQVKQHLKNAKMHFKPVSLSYSIHFDKNWNLHFNAYLFEKMDLEDPLSAFFGKWAYIEGKGFFPLQDVLFDTIQKEISVKEVSHFVNEHRVWLNSQEGFATHLASIEAHLAYTVSSEDTLIFYGRLLSKEGSIDTKDFGDWIYFDKLGFFSKKYARIGLGVRPGVEVNADAISSFIKNNLEELEAIPHFFYPFFPLKKRGLKIEIASATSVHITPEFELLPEYKEGKVRLFGDYLYLEGKGFCELPLHMRLPVAYKEKNNISGDKLAQFLEYDLGKLNIFITTLDPRIKKPIKCDLEVDYLARNPEGGMKAQLFYVSEIGKVAVTDIQEAMHKKRHYFFSDAGRLDLHEDRFQWIRSLKMPPFPGSQTVELSMIDFLRLDAIEGILTQPETSPLSTITRSLLNEFREFTVTEKPIPKELKSELRQYQQSGLYWLWFLYQNELSGLLCDEMGLGKTHQAMALIASILSKKEKKECRFLVVCPTSVIYHWQDKLAAFLPTLKVLTFHGVKRSLEKLPKECLILTSYGILRSEKEALKQIPFELGVFDEIQNAKNSRSRIHAALMTIQARMKVGLTGTPIENNLRELKALFDVVLPGFMPAEARYREFFTLPIEKEGDEEKKALLNKLIRPFILRRRKQEVLQELPEKSEDKSYCELSLEQIELYKEVLEKSREAVLSDLQDRNSPIPYVHIFSILSSLKQICNHPALALKDPKSYEQHRSGKWDLFKELLDEARESQQKVVVFSQYLNMLDIIEIYIKEKQWNYAQIRGDTSNRREQLQKFQEDPSCVIFLGSLQAAGVGIDLTAASIVILYDRWWNAAKENQAIDRVHRIGQKWGVQVYKLITKGTIEEKIDLMITKKGRLLDEIITSDDQGVLKKFTRAELIDLLSYEE